MDSSKGYQPLNSDTIFVNWNKATLLSLNNHIQLANDSSEKEIYKNRVLAFKAYVAIKDYTDFNVNSIRYKFLQELLKDTNRESDFYIIEADRSGEIVEIKNYVVFLDNNKIDKAIIYNFNNGKWVKSNSLKKTDVLLNIDLRNQFVKFGTGFNQDDVIITKFSNYTISACEYYIYSTLSNTSGLKKLLSIN